MQTDRHTESNDLLRDGKLDPNDEANHRALSLALDELTAPAQSACPIVSEICSETARCTFRPAATPGVQQCLLRDGTPFVCEWGTVHVRKCECGKADGPCVDAPSGGVSPARPKRSRTLVCR
jgi:hypothetical protein